MRRAGARREEDEHDPDGNERERGGERQVARHALLLEDDVADELVVRDETRGDVVAEGQAEGEDGARDDRRQDQRQDDPPERDPGSPAEIGGRLEHRGRDPFQAGVDRDDHVRQPQVALDEPHRLDAVAGPLQAEGREDRVDDAVLAEHEPPGVDLDEVARPQREQDRDGQQSTHPRRREACHVKRDREGDHDAGQRDRAGHDHGPERDGSIGLAGGDLLVVGQGQRRVGARRVDRPERRRGTGPASTGRR